MAPRIALIICLLCICGAFYFDRHKQSNVSHAIWFPIIWIMIAASRMVSYWITPGVSFDDPSAMQEGSSLDRNIFIILIIIGSIVLFSRKVEWKIVLQRNKWIFIFMLFALYSIAWSEFPIISLKRWIKALGNIIMVLIIVTEEDPIAAISVIIRRMAYVLIPLSIILIKYFPELGRFYHSMSGQLFITGVTTNKNALGSLCLITGLYAFWELFKSQSVPSLHKTWDLRINIILIVMILWLLVKSNSATSLASFFFGIIILSAVKFPPIRVNISHIGFYLVFSALLFTLFESSFNISSLIIQSLGKDSTLTDRTIIWQDALAFSGNTILGLGYDSFWLGKRLDYFWDSYWWHPTEVHNGYIETFLELGMIGMIILFGFLFSTFKKISEELSMHFEYGLFSLIIFMVSLIFNYTESAFKGLHLIWIMLLLISFKPTLYCNEYLKKDYIVRKNRQGRSRRNFNRIRLK